MKHPESIIQNQVVRWIQLQFPNALFTGGFDAAKLRPQQGMRRKLAGYRPGTPDILILEIRHGFHALLVEMKSPIGVLSESQTQFQAAATLRGYKYVVCRSLAEAQKEINEYFAIF